MKYLSTHPDTEKRIIKVENDMQFPLKFPVNPDLENNFKGILRHL
jgi:hypothetical protein